MELGLVAPDGQACEAAILPVAEAFLKAILGTNQRSLVDEFIWHGRDS
jgi:hypothetical protein